MGEPVVRTLSAITGAELRPLLAAEGAFRRRRFRASFETLAERILEAQRGGLEGVVVGTRDEPVRGYGYVVGASGRAVIGGLWLRGDDAASKRALVDGLVATARRLATDGRIEAQDMAFGEGDFGDELRRHGFRAEPRLFLELDLRGAVPPPSRLPAGLAARPFEPGDALLAAEIAHAAFAGTVDARLDGSYHTVVGSLELVAAVLEGASYGPPIPEASRIVLDGGGAPVAFVLTTRLGPEAAHVAQLAVRAEAGRRGIGRFLLAEAIRGTRALGVDYVSLSVTEANARALALYRATGFRVRHRYHAYVAGEPARDGVKAGGRGSSRSRGS